MDYTIEANVPKDPTTVAPLPPSLVWQNLETCEEGGGITPSARQDHTAVSMSENKVIIFGGYEASQRCNTTVCIDVPKNRWYQVQPCGDQPPSPRSLHAACSIDEENYLIVHGGEGISSGTPRSQIDKATLSPAHAVLERRSNSSKMFAPTNSAVPSSSSVCPGDSIGSTSARRAQLATQTVGDVVRCLDDFHVMHLQIDPLRQQARGTWHHVPVFLAPFARCGHTLTRVPNNTVTPNSNSNNNDNTTNSSTSTSQHGNSGDGGKGSICLFGGYNRETGTCGNSVHMISVSDILNHVNRKIKQSQSQSQSQTLSSDKTQSQSQSQSLWWRTVTCQGKPPAPRYRHSASLLQVGSSSSSYVLAIYGGLTPNNTSGKPRCDIHLLDLETFSWSTPTLQTVPTSHPAHSLPEFPKKNVKNNDGAKKSVGMALYGHCAFAVPRPPSKDDDGEGEEEEPADVIRRLAATGGNNNTPNTFTTTGPFDNFLSSGHVMLVFGGSTDPSSQSRGCVSGSVLQCFDPKTGVWSKVTSGINFPSERCGHAGVVIRGYAPPNFLPYMKNHRTRVGNNDPDDPSNLYSAIVFGGVSASMAKGDVWVLDLRWREPGVQQYDGTAEKKVEQQMVADLRKSASTPLMSRYTSPSSSLRAGGTGGTTGWGDDGSVDERVAFLKVRRENALATLTAQSERERANNAMLTIDRLSQELEAVKKEFKAEREETEEEINELKKRLEESAKREEELKLMYEMLYRKIQIAGLESHIS